MEIGQDFKIIITFKKNKIKETLVVLNYSLNKENISLGEFLALLFRHLYIY